MPDKPFKSTSYDAAQDITEAQDGFLIEQPSFAGVRKQTWILFSAIRAWILTFSEFAQMAYNKQSITANTQQIANNKGEIDGHSVDISNNAFNISENDDDISTLSGRVDGNDTDISTLDGRVDGNDTDITNLQNKTPQSYKVSDTPEFADLNITGLTGTVESRIEGNTSDISSNDTDITNLQNKTPQSYKTTDTITLVDLIITGLGNIKGIIQGLINKTPQSYKTTDAVTFATVNTGQGDNELYDMNQNVLTTDLVTFKAVKTDNVFIKYKKFTGSTDASGRATITHGVSVSKILGCIGMANTSAGVWVNMDGSTSVTPFISTSTTQIIFEFGTSPLVSNKPYRILLTYEA